MLELLDVYKIVVAKINVRGKLSDAFHRCGDIV
jgi:hypothetical protein